MCGKSEAKVDGHECKMYLGYHGGSVSIGSNEYKYDDIERVGISREGFKEILVRKGVDFLAEMILKLCENGEEA